MQNKSSLVLMAAALLLVAGLAAGLWAAPQQGNPLPPAHFKVVTPAYTDGGAIPTQYSCAVPNGITPAFQWSDPPAGTMSFAVIMHDPDGAPAKSAGDVTHWILWNIPPTASGLPEDIKPDTMPLGLAQGKNVRNVVGYQPPCPPLGATPHHYVFELFALDAKLDLPAGSTRDQLLMAMNGHVIGKATYIGIFGR